LHIEMHKSVANCQNELQKSVVIMQQYLFTFV
jgi:hypothetical protein